MPYTATSWRFLHAEWRYTIILAVRLGAAKNSPGAVCGPGGRSWPPLQVHAVKFSHFYGNNLGTMHFMWCAPESITESELLDRNMIVAQSIREKIHIFYTCAMRKEAMNTFGRICGVKPMVLREIYKRLTGYMSASRTANEAEIDSCTTCLRCRRSRYNCWL